MHVSLFSFLFQCEYSCIKSCLFKSMKKLFCIAFVSCGMLIVLMLICGGTFSLNILSLYRCCWPTAFYHPPDWCQHQQPAQSPHMVIKLLSTWFHPFNLHNQCHETSPSLIPVDVGGSIDILFSFVTKMIHICFSPVLIASTFLPMSTTTNYTISYSLPLRRHVVLL